MIFHHFLMDVNESNSFVVGCSETREALLIDAGCWSSAIAEFLEEHELTLKLIFLTHDHYDHTGGVEQFQRHYGARLVSLRGRANGTRGDKVEHGDTLRVGSIEGRVVDLSGHTADSIGLVLPGMAFSGDALFAGSVGGTGSPRAAQRQHDAIEQSLFCLPEDCEIHTGHGPSTTVGIESRYNPFFRLFEQ